MLTCERAVERLSLSLDGSLPLVEKAQLHLHLLACGHCRRFRRQVLVLDTAFRTDATGPVVPDDVRLPEDARQRITSELGRQVVDDS
ncbi:zf-HC2 domain-containing protein [Fimbriiglobus ruber]|uniref:Putative zinc-finger domain-containing protein n=1 Tax=Fimbriiglobus ruber TaxID=1908690 RepID=A0A225E093_9BACT|nr:zf-HC2 domain-containing protein [Fimbriiglobus ruber]OWK47021.1 hypothetical protein FRUB_00720 [Fimbriiglobus ruber]